MIYICGECAETLGKDFYETTQELMDDLKAHKAVCPNAEFQLYNPELIQHVVNEANAL